MSQMVPFQPASSQELMRQMAVAKMMRNPGDEAEQMSYVGLFVGSALESLRDADARGADSVARQVDTIDKMKVSDEVKGRLQTQAEANNQAWSALLQRAGDHISGLVR